MAERLYDYDPADALKSEEAVDVFLADALETRDAQHIAEAIRVVTRARASIRQPGRWDIPAQV